MEYYFCYQTEIGTFKISEKMGKITEIQLVRGKEAEKELYRQTSLMDDAIKQLKEYFSGKRTVFDLPLNPKGTEFQKKVWKELQTIPYGETRSYQQIARMVGNENATRAVGGANHNNPIMIVIPCHRVIGTNGKLTGYGGGLELKAKLLELEKENFYKKNKIVTVHG